MPFRRHLDFAALLALTLICAVVFWPLLCGQTYYWGDLQFQFHPWATFWKSEVAQGRVPLWSPGMLGGAPFVGNPQNWVLYPSVLLFIFFSGVKALALTTWLHLWLGGVLFYGWMRRGSLKLAELPSLLGACVWMLCGFFVSKAQFPNMLQSLAWVPAVLWAGEGLAARPGARAALVLGGVLALQLLAGHAQIVFLSLCMLMVYLPCRWLQPPDRARIWHVLGSGASALLLVALLACGQLLPVVESLGATQRQTLSLFEASRFAVVPWALVTLVAPYHYGNPMTGDWHYPLRVNFWESVCYMGIMPLGLGVLALWRDRRARFWALWSAGFLWLSMGVFGGLYAIAFHILPGLGRFHDAGRFAVGFSIGVAVLAALGAGWLGQKNARWVWFALLLTVLDLGVFAHNIYPFRPIAVAQTPPPTLWGRDAIIEARQGRVWQPDYGYISIILQPPEDYHQRDAANTRMLWQSAPANRNLMRGWLAEGGYDPLRDRASVRRLDALGWDRENATAFPPDMAEQLGRNSVRIVQLFRADPLPNVPGLTRVYSSPWRAGGRRLFYYRNDKALPRARWLDGQSWQTARIVKETSSRLELDVPARATTLELADAMRPGWRAFAGETPLPIQITIEGWRRVELPPASGQAQRVRFVYAPHVWKLGVFVSLCALGFWCAGMMATRKGD